MKELRETFTILNKLGLHARAAAQLVKSLSTVDAEVYLKVNKQTVNGKSIMGVLMLAASCGSKIEVNAKGKQAQEALTIFKKLIEEKFGEEE